MVDSPVDFPSSRAELIDTRRVRKEVDLLCSSGHHVLDQEVEVLQRTHFYLVQEDLPSHLLVVCSKVFTSQTTFQSLDSDFRILGSMKLCAV